MIETMAGAVEERIRGRDSETLLTMIGPERAGYTAVALQLAEAELRSRGIPAAVIAHVGAYSDRRQSADMAREAEALERIARLDDEATHCHLCGASDVAAGVPFGWGRAGDDEVETVALHLRLCAGCLSARVRLTPEEASRHPAVEASRGIGFVRFVSPGQIFRESRG